ncbi:MAG: sugar transferase [Anaerolineaceae bacterium]|jgi:exopolysaccharide biosynthesis polyprenyl glycosylphosphotransferase
MALENANLKTRWRLRSGERKWILLLGDFISAVLALLISLYFWGQADWLDFSWSFLGQRIPFWYYILPIIWIILLIEIYDLHRATHVSETIKGIATAAGLSLLLYLIIFFISESNSLPRKGIAIFIVAATALTFAWRMIYIRIFTAPSFTHHALIVGAGNAGTAFFRSYQDLQTIPLRIIGFVDDDPQKAGSFVEGMPVLGRGKDLVEIIEKNQVTDVIFAITGELNPELFHALMEAAEKGVEISSVPILYEELFGRVPIFILQSDWILRSFIDQTHTTGFYESTKKLIDIVGSLLGLLVFLVTLPLTALLIMIDSGTPIFFKQDRVGMNGRPFTMFKYRTMVKDAGKDGISRASKVNDERVTRVGKLLRKSHLDELPQFLNILKGEMSIVGPRSEQIELVSQYQREIPFYRARLFVRPGLTGWAQINQRYASNVAENGIKLEYDLYYIKHRSLILDFTIILRTVGAVVGLKGL